VMYASQQDFTQRLQRLIKWLVRDVDDVFH
jgi:hypothetical protein